MAKKYKNTSEKEAASLKESSPTEVVQAAPRYATPEMMRKSLAHVMKVHGTALQKLAK